MAGMVGKTRAEWLGSVAISPDGPVIAGTYGTWTVRYRTGVAGVDEGGRLRFRWRSVSDWAMPQFEEPSRPDYTTVRTSGGATLTPAVGVTAVRPWSKTLTIRVSEEALAPGDEVVIVLGDTSHGSPGMRAQTFPETPFMFKFDVDPLATALYEHLADLEIPVIAGDATQLYAVGPSDAVVGEPSWLQVRALDLWGNPSPTYRGTVTFGGDVPDGLPSTYSFTEADAGVHRFEGLTHGAEGIHRMTVRDEASGFEVASNPVKVQHEAPALRTYWADLHGQSGETVGTGTVPGYFNYARDIAAIDAAGHQGNDFQITPEFWTFLCEQVDAYYEPGRFVTLHGYEWSGNTTAGGDHNVYLLEAGPMQRSSHVQIEDRSDADTDRYPITELYEANRDRPDMLIIPHIGGRRADIQWHEPALEPAIEISSQWGRFEWFALEALERGYKVGFTGGSDDHSARQGWSAPTLAHHGVQGGLTAFLAPELTREALWEALRERRLYGTTNPRILLNVQADGHPIGSEYVTEAPPEISVQVHGTAGLDTVELRRGAETVYTWSGLVQPELSESPRVRIAWRGARNRGRSRALDWTGELRVWNGAITAAENYAIDSPLDGVQDWAADRVAWASHTCGDWDGLILQLDGDDDILLDFRSPAMSFRFTLADLRNGALRRDGPGLEQQVTARLLPDEPAPTDAAFTWHDDSPNPGTNPYWIWVTQEDGELAWSSPIYMEWRG